MGRSYWFECSRCGYRAKVSGGSDRGLHFFVQTVACRECKHLYDAVIRLRLPVENDGLQNSFISWRRGVLTSRREFNSPPTFESALNRLLYKGHKRWRWTNFKLQCPVSAYHHIQSWNAPDKCPRCGLYLERAAIPYRIWE